VASIHGLDADLTHVAPAVGADVAFFLSGGAALVEGAGELVTVVETTPAWFALAWPRVELSTQAVYKAWDEVNGDGPNQLRRAAGHADRRVEEFAERLGPQWQMTGSGSAFFRTFADREDAVAATHGLDCWNAVTSAIGRWG
jgi:4-diphosphocytidyl-2C-methyl-D-erythritol kinase